MTHPLLLNSADELIHALSQLSPSVRYLAFAMCAGIIVLQIFANKKSRLIPTPIVITLLVIIALLGALPYVADAYVQTHSHPRGYTIIVDIVDSTGRPISEDVGVQTHPAFFIKRAGTSYEIPVSEAPDDSVVTLFAGTNKNWQTQKIRIKLAEKLKIDTIVQVNKAISQTRIPPKKHVELTYDPNKIRHVQDAQTSDTWFFEESSPVIKIDGKVCTVLTGCTVPGSPNFSSMEEAQRFAAANAKTVAEAYLSTHPEKLNNCLH